MTCIIEGCARKALPERNRCDAHIHLLIEAIFGGKR